MKNTVLYLAYQGAYYLYRVLVVFLPLKTQRNKVWWCCVCWGVLHRALLVLPILWQSCSHTATAKREGARRKETALSTLKCLRAGCSRGCQRNLCRVHVYQTYL